MKAAAGARLSDIDPAQWDALTRDDDPFTSYAYLSALEDTGQAGPGTRWAPCHVTCTDDNGRLIGALPLYEKTDSWGEFVFDFAWANAYEQSIGPYYPKLVSAVPYSPVGGRRLLVAPDVDVDPVRRALIDAAVAHLDETGASSWHVQFCHGEEIECLHDAGLLPRHDCQFHWFNRDFTDFDDYLASFRSSRRKKTRRERRRVQEAGVTFTTRHGDELDGPEWAEFYAFYASSFLVRGREPYFTP
ncbi:MAG: peptidogalycan biosysnthesis protein, partial [Pseudomonadota bacterium]